LLTPGWHETVDAAEEANDPGDFTAYIAYEWTSNPGSTSGSHEAWPGPLMQSDQLLAKGLTN
jgi:hypothetical protein